MIYKRERSKTAMNPRTIQDTVYVSVSDRGFGFTVHSILNFFQETERDLKRDKEIILFQDSKEKLSLTLKHNSLRCDI